MSEKLKTWAANNILSLLVFLVSMTAGWHAVDSQGKTNSRDIAKMEQRVGTDITALRQELSEVKADIKKELEPIKRTLYRIEGALTPQYTTSNYDPDSIHPN